MAGTRGGNRNIFGRIDLGIPTCSMALTPRNHYSLSYNIVLKNLKCSAPFYEAPIRHESCQTTAASCVDGYRKWRSSYAVSPSRLLADALSGTRLAFLCS